MAQTLIQMQGVAKHFGARQIFADAAFAVNEGEHVGVIGPNGAGKTTLFKMLIGEETLDAGETIRSRSLRLGYLSQHDAWGPEETIEDYLSRGTVTPIWELKALGAKLGLSAEMFARPVASFSGGYRMRCKLLYLLGCEPNLMLLDEPTNYLDLETLMVLENFLQNYEGAFMLISHDREFLRRTTDHILEVEGGDLTKYNGNIDDYFEQKTLLRTQLEARAMSLAEKKKQVMDFVNRFGAKASKARQAQSRLKSLDRMETIELKALPVSAKIKIPPPARTGKLVLDIKDAELGYPERLVIQKASLQINAGDHVAVVGLNGAGKTTLLKSIAGELKPRSGSVERGYEVTIGYYAQHVAERLNPSRTVIEAMTEKAHPSVKQQEALNLAGSLLFSGDDMYKKIQVLSGGEKSRVALGQILLQKCTCLILDEPTNHLDFQTVESLTQALVEYPGTVITVSHDRSFVGRVGTKILEVKAGNLNLYHGTYDDYVWRLQQALLHAPPPAESAPKPAAAPKPVRDESKEQRVQRISQQRTLQKKIEQAEKKMHTLTEQVHALNEKISSADPAKSKQLIDDLVKTQAELHAVEELWIEASDELSKLL